MTTTTATCTQPGCGGTIDDGYCIVCGLAASSALAPVTGQAQSLSVGSAATSTIGIRGTYSSATGSARGNFGSGLVEIPPVPAHDPAGAILADPQVPESQRFCSNPACEQPVGQARDGRPGLTDGFCPHCGTQFSFTPKLEPGELVVGQYEVLGCLAHGGLGWIYLAMDHNLGKRWVVLKGLLNTGD
ncbi:MAG TPA: serine/threonine protein kinase, partial [Streptosporangiaceae bacterium]